MCFLSNFYFYLINYAYYDYIFFFSSRSRHTRVDCDWSSDVCSSDLFEHVTGGVVEADGSAGLQGHPGMTADGEIEFDHRMGGGECRIDVAKAVAHGERRGVAAVVEFAGRIGCGHERRQRLDLDLDEIGGILGDIGVVGE